MAAMTTLATALALAAMPAMSQSAAQAQGTSAYRSADAVAGEQQRLGVYGNVQKDCTSGPLPTVRVLTPPKRGELNVRSGKLKPGRISLCPKLEATAEEVFYKANAAFKGTGKVAYEVRSASGKVESHTVKFTVKEASAAGREPGSVGDANL